MVSGFDIAATLYDGNFTFTPIGRLQRKRVYKYLDPYLNTTKTMNILELNCGTGEDAIYMAENGHHVLATDLSADMLLQAKKKAPENANIQFRQLDIKALHQHDLSGKPDLVVSNFGGLNCISPDQFEAFFSSASDKLAKTGRIVAVIMSKKCLWERLYFFLKGKSGNAFRRSSRKPLDVPVNGKMVPTWYYDPLEITRIAEPFFTKVLIKPVGFLIPPSYLNSYFRNKKSLLKILAWLENSIFSMSFLSAYSDHYIIILQKK